MKERKLSEYQQKLLDPRWQRKRLGILQRDEWRCQACWDDETTLHVHHHYYGRACEPWEYPDEALVTLCATCHQLETENRQEIEQGLLRILREIGIAYHAIDDLAYSFGRWGRGNCHDLRISAIAWALRDEEMMADIVLRYTEMSHSDLGSARE
jgi:hypothetical protein